MDEKERFLAVSVVAGILAANRTTVPRWEQTAARQALGVVKEVERLLAEERQPAEPSRNLTQESVEHWNQTESSPEEYEAGLGAMIGFVELTKRLDPINLRKRSRRETTFREYVQYLMVKTNEVQRLLGDEDLPVSEGREPSASDIDTRMDQLRAQKFAPLQVNEIEEDFVRFLEGRDSPRHKRLLDLLIKSRKKFLEPTMQKIAKAAVSKRSNRQKSDQKRIGATARRTKKGS
ncbi:hypothetical protein [Luteolibacter sp. Populi]|uniref:hypothetical protein n=1 Tax=Luteolibacter sp. Populi TaxID=3230487 RepID=UPI00346690D0